MAQLRAEVRPVVSNMPTEGFTRRVRQAPRRAVRQDFPPKASSYRVTGVPGHTHNASAVCSVLVDNTEKSNVDLIINNHFAYQQVQVAAERYTDSYESHEREYDRALERGIGEIAIIPENCHQEIREPARAIGELRTLVMPKDKRDTLTYVEEVGVRRSEHGRGPRSRTVVPRRGRGPVPLVQLAGGECRGSARRRLADGNREHAFCNQPRVAFYGT